MFAGYGSCIFGYVCFDGLLFLFGCSLTCSSFWNCQLGDLGHVCLGGLLLSLAIPSCALVFWNCQIGDLGYYVCFGGLLFFLFGYSLMHASIFELPIWRSWLCVLGWPNFFFSLAILSCALVFGIANL